MKLDPHFDSLDESHLLIVRTVTQSIQDSTLSYDHAIPIYMVVQKNLTIKHFPVLLSNILTIS